VRLTASAADHFSGFTTLGGDYTVFKRMLVPIDGTHASAAVIPYAATVAQRLDC
jgi:hypothetical protein